MAYSRPSTYSYPRQFKSVDDAYSWAKQLYAELKDNDVRSEELGHRVTDKDLKELIVRPEWYGAKGDGVTDDVAALNSAIAALKAKGGGKLLLGSGTYRITAPLEIDCEITVEGVGRGDRYAGTPKAMSKIYLDHDDPTCAIWIKPGTRGVILKDFYLAGNKNTAGATTGKGIWVDGSTDTVVGYTFQSLTICDFKECGIALFDNTYMGLFIDLHIVYNEQYGVYSSEPNTAWGPLQHRFYGCVIGNNGTADVYNDSNSFIANFDGCTFCGTTDNGIYNNQGRIWVNNCYFEEVATGITHIGSGGANVGGLWLSNNIFISLSTASVALTNPDNVFIGKNEWIGSPSSGHLSSNAYYGENNYVLDPYVATSLTGFSCFPVSPRQSVGGIRYGTEALRLAAGDHVANELYIQSDDGVAWWYDGATWTELSQALKTTDGPTFDHLHVTNDAAVASVTAMISEPDVITNGGFGSATTGWSAERGTLASVAGGQAGNCLQLTCVSGATQDANQALTGKMEPGATYTLSAYVKSGTSGDEAYQIVVYDTAWNALLTINGTTSGSWVEKTNTFVQSAGDTGGSVFLVKGSATAGTMLFDTVAITRTQRAAVTDGFVSYAEDITAGNAAPHFRTEAGDVVKLFKGDAVADADSGTVVAQLNTLLARLRAHGLIAT